MAINQVQLASRLGVSQRAVSFALSGKPGVSADTRRRIIEAAKRLGYRPNSAARSMRSRRTRQIGVLIYDAGKIEAPRTHSLEFVTGVNAELEPQGYTTCLVQLSDVERDVTGVARVFREQALDGMVVLASLAESVREQVGQLMPRCIWCDAGIREPEGCLWRDEELAGRLAAEALVKAGCERIYWLYAPARDNIPRHYDHSERRLAGAKRVLDPLGLCIESIPLDFDKQQAFHEALTSMSPGAGLLVSEYHNAPLIIQNALLHRGWCAGREYSLACCDDLADFHRMMPDLSRARFDRFRMGRQAALMMLQRINRPDDLCKSIVDRPLWIPGKTVFTSPERS